VRHSWLEMFVHTRFFQQAILYMILLRDIKPDVNLSIDAHTS